MSAVPPPEADPGSWTRGYDLGVKMGSNEALYRAGVLLVPNEIVQLLEGDDLDRWSAFAAGVDARLATASGPAPEVVHLPQEEIARFSAGLQSGLGRGRALAATKRTAYSRTIQIDARDLRQGDLFCGPAEAKPRTPIPGPVDPGWEIIDVVTPPGHGDLRFELNREGPGRVILVDPATRVMVWARLQVSAS